MIFEAYRSALLFRNYLDLLLLIAIPVSLRHLNTKLDLKKHHIRRHAIEPNVLEILLITMYLTEKTVNMLCMCDRYYLFFLTNKSLRATH